MEPEQLHRLIRMEYRKIVLSSLNRKEALRYMGQGTGSISRSLEALMDTCEERVLQAAEVRYLYRVVDICEAAQGVKIAETNFLLKGLDIKNHLKGCDKAVIFCATLSVGIDRLIHVTQKQDIAGALAVDALASTAIEQACDKIEFFIKDSLPQYHFTWRYGVGYGDFPIEQQADILAFLDAPRKIGLNVTASHMLTPGKSVTAVMGLSREKLEKRRLGCADCNLKGTCQFRKEGKFCNDKEDA